MAPKKNILITGCSSGIGHDAALTLNKKGWRVFATCRSRSDCKYFESLGIESFPLDLSDEESKLLKNFEHRYLIERVSKSEPPKCDRKGRLCQHELPVH